MAQRLKGSLELKRELRRKKNDHLDKKRARDFHVNLTELKATLNHQTSSLVLENRIDSLKPEGKKSCLKVQSLPETTSPKITTLMSPQRITATKRPDSLLSLGSLSSPQGSKISSLGDLKAGERTIYQSHQILKPEFKCKPPFRGAFQNSHSKKPSIEIDLSSPVKRNIRLESLHDAATKRNKTVEKHRIILKSETSPKLSSEDLSVAYDLERQATRAKDDSFSNQQNQQGLSSVKDQVTSLTNISNKLEELSTAITHNLYLLGVHNTKTTPYSHKHTKSTQLIRDGKFWDHSSQESEILSFREQETQRKSRL